MDSHCSYCGKKLPRSRSCACNQRGKQNHCVDCGGPLGKQHRGLICGPCWYQETKDDIWFPEDQERREALLERPPVAQQLSLFEV